jgi:hypothetical protein
MMITEEEEALRRIREDPQMHRDNMMIFGLIVLLVVVILTAVMLTIVVLNGGLR